MTRYFFDVCDGSSKPDQHGTELPDHRAARRAAIRLAGAIMKDSGDDAVFDESWRIEVRDGEKHLLMVLMFTVAESCDARRTEFF